MSALEFFEIASDADIVAAYPVLKTLMPAPNGLVDFVTYQSSLSKAQANGYFLYGCRQESELVGLAGVRIMHDPWNGQPYAYINNLVVLPQHRGLGIGTQLLDYVEQTAIGLGVGWLGLNVRVENDRARKLYENRDYVPAATLMWRTVQS